MKNLTPLEINQKVDELGHLSMEQVIYHSIQSVFGIAEISPARAGAIRTLTASAGKKTALNLLKKALFESASDCKDPHIKALTLWLKLAREIKYSKKCAGNSRAIDNRIDYELFVDAQKSEPDFISPYD